MNAMVLSFASDGTVQGLYSELIDLHEIGQLEITRASTVEFNNQSQQWEVQSLKGDLLYSHPSRSVCLDWERENLVP